MTTIQNNTPEIAIIKKRSKANLIDLFIFLLIIFLFLNNDSLHYLIKIICIAGYPVVILPIFISLGGTLGQRMLGLVMRRNTDHSRFPNLLQAFLRLALVFINNWIGVLGFRKENRFYYEIASNTVVIDIASELSDEEKEIIVKRKAKINFIIAAIIYTAWVVWLGNYWFILGLLVIFDIYISKKVNWTPWKKRYVKNPWFIEWLDALIFAVVAVTIINIFLFQNYKIPTGSMEKSLLIGDHLYVSKVAYGPRIPQTPLSIPFMQHTIPGTNTKSYVEWIKLPYKRLAGFGKIQRDDPVVFNFPAGDTVCREKELQSVSYYYIVRAEAERLKQLDQYAKQPLKSDKEYYALGRAEVWRKHDILVRPVDRRDNYIKRCVAIPGDTLQVINGVVYINGQREKVIPGIQYDFALAINGRPLNTKRLKDMGISPEDISYNANYTVMQVPLTDALAEEISRNKLVKGLDILIRQRDYYDNKMFPHDKHFQWNLDHYGPIYMPKKGATITITPDNLPLYERIIDYYEDNDLELKDSIIYVNGEATNHYTFKMDYYWMMGDNRHHSLDSRYWGYVPEDHIVGKPRFIWLSLNRDKHFPTNIRLKRMFHGIK